MRFLLLLFILLLALSFFILSCKKDSEELKILSLKKISNTLRQGRFDVSKFDNNVLN